MHACRPKYTPTAKDEIRSVYTWGDGEWGQLGHGPSYTRELCKTIIKGGPQIQQQAIMRETTSLPTPRQVEALFGIPVVAMSAKGQHSMCITEQGDLYTFGCGVHGRLGHGDHKHRNLPTVVEAFAGKERIINVSAGQYHSACISLRGEVFTWGKGEHGQLGQGEANMMDCLRPVRVSLLSINVHMVITAL
jgi:alpha-tubulin suppressor-like RCC1 family protein